MHNQAPMYLMDQFHKVIDTTYYNRRNNDINLKLPKPNTDYLKKSFIYQGYKLGMPCRPKLECKLR